MIDCMACLVSLAEGVPEGGSFKDCHGITHATIRMQYEYFLTCTVRPDPDDSRRALIDWARCRMVADER